MSEPFATICCLSFNRPEFVSEAIRSAVREAQMPVEVIVHDDGSQAPTLDVLYLLRELGLISTLILNQRGHNEGQGIALNRMFHMAKGDPIVKFDHDLVCHPGWLLKAATVLKTNESRPNEPNIGALGLFKYYANHPVDSTNTFVRTHDGWEEHRDFVGSAMVIPRRAWEKFGPFRERSAAFAEDYQFNMDVSGEPDWCCGLMPNDLVTNQGFGLGPSTVAIPGADGGIDTQTIKEGPFLCESS